MRPTYILGHGVNVEDVDAMLSALQRMNAFRISRNPALVRALRGVVYRREERGPDGRRKEEWLPIDEVVRRGYADCEDLAAAYAAAFSSLGREAHARAVRISPILIHCVVYRRKRGGDFGIVDPSKLAGM